MILSTELRKGNLVIKDSHFATIESVDIDEYCSVSYGKNLNGKNHDFHVATKDLIPIPISGIWLLRYGFISTEISDYEYTFGRRSLMVTTDTMKDGTNDIMIFYRHDIGLDYAEISSSIINFHDLQNLVYLLLGEELKLCQ
ncbi:MAG: hypothetical protein LLG05_14215 [Porphyromonadaceae bacterium]|nr:hypothetical protein [Porphyromonadaceae bacterium]